MSEDTTAETDYDGFRAVDVRVGTVARAEPLVKARVPAYKLWVDLGAELGVRTSSAQLTKVYTPEDLVGRQVLAVVNLPPRRVAGFKSQVLVLGLPAAADRAEEVVLVAPEREVSNGVRMF